MTSNNQILDAENLGALERVSDLLSFDDQDRRDHARDEWPLSAKWTDDELEAARPLAVAHPKSTAEVAAVVSASNEAGISLVPYGAGSGVLGGVTSAGKSIALDLRGISDVISFLPDSATITVGAGMLGGDVETYLSERGYTLGHYPQSLYLATAGGLVATRSSGTFSSKYGNIEDRLLALEVVLADGTIVQTKGTPRSSTGPSIAQLFVGSEGTLGVITAVSFRILPKPETIVYSAITFDSVLDGAVASVHAILNAGIRPAVIRIYDEHEAAHLRGLETSDGTALLLLAFDGPTSLATEEQSLALAISTGLGGTDHGSALGESWNRGRYNAAWIAPGNAGDTRMADAIEVSASWADLGRVYTRIHEAVDGTIAQVWSHFSHFYMQGGSLYVIIFIDAGDKQQALDQFTKTWDSVMSIVLEEGGSVSHHHGIGAMRLPWFREESGTAFTVLERVKSALDPKGTLNPGKLALSAK